MGAAKHLSSEDVVAMLQAAGLTGCVEAAEANQLSGEDLRLLTDGELKEELGWSDDQVAAVRAELAKLEGDPDVSSPADVTVDFSAPTVPQPSEDTKKFRSFTSGKAAAPVSATKASLAEFDRLTKRILELEGMHVETAVSRTGAKLVSIQQYLAAEKVVLEKLRKEGENAAKASEAAESGFYCGKLFAMCSGKHEANVQKRAEELEAAKKKEKEKIAQLEQARKDLASTDAELRAMQARVGELQGCRQSEMALVEGLFDAGTIRDDAEQQLKRAYLDLGPQLHQVREYKRTYSQADELLANAAKQVTDGMQFLQRAMGVNRMDQVGNIMSPGPGGGGGNLMMELAKKRNIAMAEELCNHAKANVIQAKTILPAIPNIKLAEIQQLRFALQLVFDNVVSDAIAGRKIQANIRQMQEFKQTIEEGRRWVHGWLSGRIDQDLAQLEGETKQSKAALDAHRRQLLAAEVAKL
mmetsp:Transcript_9577/g.24302  ORF Transcript_9577/g.24302 Transcript_9577/m.24302 type:complete len:469 (+) Transcript_9577:88-1494(+)